VGLHNFSSSYILFRKNDMLLKKQLLYKKLILLTTLIVGSFYFGMSSNLVLNNLETSEVSIPKPDSVTVYLFFRIDCKICEYYTRDLEQLYERYKEDNISFVAVFPNFMDKPSEIERYCKKFGLPFGTKTDYSKRLTKKFKATVTPEVVVYNETKETILYQGRIDNTYYKLGRKRSVTTSSELATVLESHVNGEMMEVEFTQAVGCFIQ